MNTNSMTVDVTLLERPEVDSIASALALDRYGVIGMLMYLLAWYRTAEATIVSAAHIDAIVQREGFAAALCNPAIGWLAPVVDGAVRPHGFLRDEVARLRHRGWRSRSKKTNVTIAPVTQDASPVIESVSPALRVGEVLKPSTEPEGGLTLEAQNEEEKIEQSEAHAPTEDIASTKFILPDWIPEESWREFCVMRVKMRKPLTHYAKMLMVRELDELRRDGEDPRAVLEQSIMRGWQGIFKTRGRDGRWQRMQPVTDNLDFESGATREEDIPDWAKGTG